MQLHSADTVLQTNTGAKIKAFTIEATAKSFAILSSSLYSDKITAIIRELSCNALDAHVDAGNSELFVIHLPTTLEPYFYVEDFGTGMSPEMIENLYSTYFSSTKNARNDQIGALGLGSKSPFAYTDMFTIDSTYNGVRYTYSAAISDKGIPSLIFLNKKEVVGKHNGVKIQFAVKSDDFESFTEKAVYTLWRFTPRPKVIGGTNTYERLMSRFEKDMIVKLQGKGWTFYDSFPRWSDTAKVLMGNILYDVRSLASDPMFEKYEAFFNTAFVFEMPIGSCDITPSRETLSFDDLTKRNILIKLEQISNEISLMLKEKTNEASTLWEASFRAREFYHTLNLNRGKGKTFFYKNVLRSLGESVPLLQPAFSYRVGTKSWRRAKITFGDPRAISELVLGNKYLIVEMTTDSASSWKNSALKSRLRLYSEKAQDLENTTIVFVKGPAPLAMWGNPQSIKVQDLPKLKTSKGPVEDITFEMLHSAARKYQDLLRDDNFTKIAYVISYKKKYHWGSTTLESKKDGTDLAAANSYFARYLSSWLALENRVPIAVIPCMVWKRLSKTAAFKNKFLSVEEFVNRTMQEKVVKNLAELSKLYCARTLTSYYDTLLRRFASSTEYNKLPVDSPFKISMEDLKVQKFFSNQTSTQLLDPVYKFYCEIVSTNLIKNLPRLAAVDPYKFFERYPFLSVFFNERCYYSNYSEDTLRTSPFKNSDAESKKVSIFEEVYRYINMVEGRIIAE